MADEEATEETGPANAEPPERTSEDPSDSSPEAPDEAQNEDDAEAAPDAPPAAEGAPEETPEEITEAPTQDEVAAEEGAVKETEEEEDREAEAEYDEEGEHYDEEEGHPEESREREDVEEVSKISDKEDSLEALVKSSSLKLDRDRSMGAAHEEDSFSKTFLMDDKKDKHAAKAKEVLGEVIDIRRGSQGGDLIDKRTARYMNTYKLYSDKPFNSEVVDKILLSVMNEALEDLKYEPEKCCKQAKWASNTIKAKVKQMEFERYKIISVVSIGEKHNQDILYTCRFLWDEERDNYSCVTMENPHIFGTALCFGLYYE